MHYMCQQCNITYLLYLELYISMEQVTQDI